MSLRLRRGPNSERINTQLDIGELVYVLDHEDQNVSPLFVGDGSLGGKPVIQVDPPQPDIDDLTNVLLNNIQVGEILKWDGQFWTNQPDVAGLADGSGIIEGSNYGISIVSQDSSIIVDYETGTLRGKLLGDVAGDLTGSVFADDSTPMVDGLNLLLSNGFLTLQEDTILSNLNLKIGDIDDPTTTTLIQYAPESNYKEVHGLSSGFYLGGSGPTEKVFGSSGSLSIPETSAVGNILATKAAIGYDSNNEATFSSQIMQIVDDFGTVGPAQVPGKIVFLMNDDETTFAGVVINRLGHVGIGDGVNIDPPEHLSVYGNALISGNVTTGELTATSLKGSLMADDSTTIVDGIEGNITAPGFVQFGSFTTAERNTLNATNGMVIYNTTANKFQGYQNNSWINLDDGTAA